MFQSLVWEVLVLILVVYIYGIVFKANIVVLGKCIVGVCLCCHKGVLCCHVCVLTIFVL